jgi:urease accessory protein
MFDVPAALALMQYGDSAYPAGGFAFSWGVEGLAADGWIRGAADLAAAMREHLSQRWNSMDRPLLARGYRAETLLELQDVDRDVEAATLSSEMREGSRRAGRALIGVAARRKGPLAIGYRASFAADECWGHLPVAQAIAYRDAGLELASAEIVSGWALISGLVSAATRLGLIGHVEAQDCLDAARRVLAELLSEPCPEDSVPSSFTPLIDIAVSRGRARAARLFAT